MYAIFYIVMQLSHFVVTISTPVDMLQLSCRLADWTGWHVCQGCSTQVDIKNPMSLAGFEVNPLKTHPRNPVLKSDLILVKILCQ